MNRILPIAAFGAVLLALLIAAASAFALRRRRRRREEMEAEEARVAKEQAAAVEEQPVAAIAPAAEPEVIGTAAAAPMAAVRAEPRHDPVAKGAPVTPLPAGFDLSRFGPHVQAAYRGPTADNPSLSLRYRLRKAAAMDQRERLNAETRSEPRVEEAAPNDGGFMLREESAEKAQRPAYSD